MRIYHHHPETGEYLGESIAQPDPLEPGRWLIPAHATTDEPPAVPDGKRARRVADAWALEDKPEPPALLPQNEPPSAAQVRAWAIEARLQAIDAASVRPARELMRAQAKGQPAPAFAVTKLDTLETEAATLRAEMKGLAL